MKMMNGRTRQNTERERKLTNRAIGDRAECAAARILRAEGYRVLDRNYTVNGGEIDLIAEKCGILVFVEVKARRSMHFGEPQEYVNPIKRRRLIYAAKRYLYQQNTNYDGYRFDVFAFDLSARTYKWFRDAFGFGG